MAIRTARLGYGELVVDREDDDPDLAVVVNHPPERADGWTVDDRGRTVADDNPDYPADCPVVVVCFHDRLAAFDPGWASFPDENRSLAELADAGVGYYAFPRPRLRRAPPELAAEAIEPTDRTAALFDRLDGHLDCYLEDERTVVCEKLGETYRVRPGGDVDGGGALAERLAAIAADY